MAAMAGSSPSLASRAAGRAKAEPQSESFVESRAELVADLKKA